MNKYHLHLTAGLLALTLSITALAQSDTSVEVKVNGLVCAFCAQGITSAFSKQPATDEVYVSLENQLVAIALKKDMDMDNALIEKTLVDAGYDVVSMERTNRTLAMIKDQMGGHGSPDGGHQPRHE